jgi:dihydrofolate synthase/folylpolyglutamate synthase
MTFEAASAYLLGTINETLSRRAPHRLDRMRMLLHELGDPQAQYPTIQIGGTSGKGSTSTMVAAALTAAGKRTGLHTKPHLASMTERARLDGRAIGAPEFGDLLGEMMPAIERTASVDGRPSYYETLLALALDYFARERVDVGVVEVGLGGALDGTNVLEPCVNAITNVGFDHTDVLGDTLEAIATDKSGIAKPGVPLITDARNPGALAVIAQRCAEVGAPLVQVEGYARIEPHAAERYGQSFAVTTPNARYELALPILGDFQQRNAATAIAILEALPPELRPSVEAVEAGFAQLAIPGRMEFFPGFPDVVFDIAHNPDKAEHLARALLNAFPDRRFTFVIGISETKDAPEVLRPLFALPASFIFTSFETAGRRATRPQRLVNIAEHAGIWARAIADPVEALSVARRSTDANGVVIVTGSTFVVAAVRQWWIKNVADSLNKAR